MIKELQQPYSTPYLREPIKAKKGVV